MVVKGLVGNEQGILFNVLESENTAVGTVLSLQEVGTQRVIYLAKQYVEAVES